MMKVTPQLIRICVASATATSLVGFAAAATIEGELTGPQSNQQATINSRNVFNSTNLNHAEVDSKAVQAADTGGVVASYNTQVGGSARSGDSSNRAAQATTVAIENPTGGFGQGPDPILAQTIQPGRGNGPDMTATTGVEPGGRGNVLGSQPGAPGAGNDTLPGVGAAKLMNVSSWRDQYRPVAKAPSTAMASQGSGLALPLLVLASVLSLVGAGTSAIKAHRRAKVVG